MARQFIKRQARTLQFAGFALFCLLAGSQVVAQVVADNAGAKTADWGQVGKMILLLIPVLVIFTVTFFSLRHISRQFQKACSESFQLDTYAKSPLGLPEGTIGAVLGLVGGALFLYLLVVVLLKYSFFGAEFNIDDSNGEMIKSIVAAVGAIVMLVLIIMGAVFYMQRLQKRFFEGCIENKQVNQFFEAPAGLPAGTIRAILALVIVAVSLSFITLQFFVKGQDRIPEGLMTLLSAVVAFYFANRASTQGAADAVARQTHDIKEQRDNALKEQDKSKAETNIGKLKKGLRVIKAATAFLPAEQRKKYESLAGKLETGLSTAENLLGDDNANSAKDLVTGALAQFSRNNPAYESIAKAIPAFSKVLGNSIPAFAIISALTTIGVKIGKARHEKWKRRILQLPIKAASFPVDIIDGFMAEQEFKADPVLARAFADALTSGSRVELKDAAVDFINSDDDDLWTKYGQRFDSREEMEQSVQTFRRVFSDEELQNQIESEWLGQVGSYKNLVSAVDKIHQDEAALASLDEISLVYESLQQEGQPVLQILGRVEEELKNEKII